jgi:ubiquinone/menaquinone biosynthesis C-methylase UbiE
VIENGSRPFLPRAVRDGTWHGYLSVLLLTSTARLFEILQRMPWYRQMLQDWVSTLDSDTDGDWLEVGCGPALLTAMLGNRGQHAIGLDHSAAMLRHATRLPEVNAADIGLVRGSATALPFAPQSFDRVIAASLINVVPDPVAVLKEMVRVTRANGWLSCLVPSTAMTAANVEHFIRRVELEGAHAAALRLWCGRARRIGQTAVVDYFQTAGLKHIHCMELLDGMVLAVSARR